MEVTVINKNNKETREKLKQLSNFSSKIKKLSPQIKIELNEDYIQEHFELWEIKDVFFPLNVSNTWLHPTRVEEQRVWVALFYRGWFGKPDDQITYNNVWLNFIEHYPQYKKCIKITCKKTSKRIDYFSIDV